MVIAVTTPTGNVGRHVVAGLVRAGVRPRVLLRDPSRLEPAIADLVDPVAVDQRDDAAVLAATEGVDALYWVSPTTWSGDPVAEHARMGGIAARAVRANGVRRVVFQSSVGAERRSGAGEIDGLARTEEALDGTGADVVHLRCGYFTTNLLHELDAIRAGVLRVVLPVDRPMPWVAPRDVADVAVGRLLNPHWSGPVVQAVHGPADLTWQEAAAVVADVCRRPLRVERIPDDSLRRDLADAGMGPELVEAVLGMSTGMRDDFTPEQPRDATTTTPTTLGAWVLDALRPALDGDA
jgi:uncharacterized protein YbjT (DUF2867 family)